ncbi:MULTISPECIES: ArsR/SmtB family transcription factor [Larsenimonas]|uniref:Metalloregulator ArsR/SmtB family transcription factor n=1 Tax=Larsenimonas suaedae TaxID=1851019 RepID=A0ABU1GVV0_9GAMM|nr:MULTISPECIES: metalloregulator ArsR/SmtB family transcription factor [Larsenimonas]MCM2973278.1 helix-turn-helix domain-containing protein [Larsenimonas suaedae]MCM5705705.1 helix-turn-helix domain-containing protein [Larsenimonas salina]MDR5896171.1 metalloregulator ArsR/SmtB family transcription factor [Larsenimonas suaedae]
MDINTVISALANPVRLDILSWLKAPERHFPPQKDTAPEGGICVSHIREKTGLSQPTISLYLSTLSRAGLVSSQRVGQWTYYRYERDTAQAFLDAMAERL